MSTLENRRILLVDDQASIHEDFREVLSPPAFSTDLDADEALLFNSPNGAAPVVRFEMDSAFQGAEGLEEVRAAHICAARGDARILEPPGYNRVSRGSVG
jgi:two-component system, NtrC family, sensor kinase